MIDAKTAYSQSKENYFIIEEQIDLNARVVIGEAIYYAIKSGCFNTTVPIKLSPKILSELLDLGYQVVTDSAGARISWTKGNE